MVGGRVKIKIDIATGAAPNAVRTPTSEQHK